MIRIGLELITERKLNIGAGGIAPKIRADIPFTSIIDFNGSENIIIPGSTIKGVLRASLIKISNLLGYDHVTYTVNPDDEMDDDIVTRLFGKPNNKVQSKVSVSNAIVKVKTETLTHVKINDNTRTAERRGLFSVEYLPIGCIISLTIEARDLSVEEARALMAAIANLKYERIGKSGIVDVKIKDSYGFDKYLSDPIIKEIYDSLR